MKSASTLITTDLRCEYLRDPPGVDEKEPRLSWGLVASDADAYGQRQTAYRILVSRTAEALAHDRGDLWDSSGVESDRTTQIAYAGEPLTSGLDCFWKVRVRDENGVWSAWSQPARWSMGLLDPADWTARWIGSDQVVTDLGALPDQPLMDPWLRKSFALDAVPQRATIHVASVGYHELYVNGVRVGDAVLSPVTTDHRRRARYMTYDIADLLRKGRNAIALWLGTSWSIYFAYKTEHRPQTPMVIAQAEIELPDGTCQRVVTDGTWKTHPSPNKLLGRWSNGQFGGEAYDARREQPDWNRVEFDDTAWPAATVYAPKLELSAAMMEPNRRVEAMTPVEIRETGPGVYRADFGRVFTGMLECDVRGTPGDTVEFLVSERADQESTFSFHDRYVIGAAGKGTFQNRFNYFVGRWVTIKGLGVAPKPADLRAWRVRPDFERAGTFECSNPLLNEIYRTTLWTLENLTLGGMFTDCQSRERTGYGGGGGDVRSGLWSYRLGGFFNKWFQDWCDVRCNPRTLGTPVLHYPVRPGPHEFDDPRQIPPEDNPPLPASAPNGIGGGGPWTMFGAVRNPWEVYSRTGDRRNLERNYPLLRDWLAWIEKHTRDNLLVQYAKGYEFLGDWVWPGAPMSIHYRLAQDLIYCDLPETQFFCNCDWVYTLRVAAKYATALGHAEQARGYARRADEVAAAVHRKFFNADDNSYLNCAIDGQANMAIALAAGIPPNDLVPAVLARLERQIKGPDQGRLNAGQVGLTYLFQVLHEQGRDDLVLPMLNTREYPGWGHMLAQGATTWWEDFQAEHSLQHFSYLQPAFWLVEAVGGLNADPESIGFKHFIVKPNLWREPSLTWARTSYLSEEGPIEASWRVEDGGFRLEVMVPPNTTATVYVPARHRAGVCEDRGAFKSSGLILWLRDEDGYVVFTVQPGRYVFSSRPETRE